MIRGEAPHRFSGIITKRNIAMPKLKIEYQEISLEDVIRYFADGFKVKIEQYEWFLDAQKGKVIFKLYVESIEENPADSK